LEHRFRTALAILMLGSVPPLITACSEGSLTPAEDTSQPVVNASSGGIGPLCQLGCVETDPDPESAGVFLGSGVTDEVCFAGGQTDTDLDGLSTFCEKILAGAFAPELWYASNDDVGGEPHWVARPLNGS
jgi:hypothetical protein